MFFSLKNLKCVQYKNKVYYIQTNTNTDTLKCEILLDSLMYLIFKNGAWDWQR